MFDDQISMCIFFFSIHKFVTPCRKNIKKRNKKRISVNYRTFSLVFRSELLKFKRTEMNLVEFQVSTILCEWGMGFQWLRCNEKVMQISYEKSLPKMRGENLKCIQKSTGIWEECQLNGWKKLFGVHWTLNCRTVVLKSSRKYLRNPRAKVDFIIDVNFSGPCSLLWSWFVLNGQTCVVPFFELWSFHFHMLSL
jgi:hypothetical protein